MDRCLGAFDGDIASFISLQTHYKVPATERSAVYSKRLSRQLKEEIACQ